jgi:hypothetical protein
LDHFSLLESEPFHELWHWCNGLSKTDAEELSGRSFVRPDTTIIGPGEEILLPEQSERVTGKLSSASSSGARRRMSPRRKRRRW